MTAPRPEGDERLDPKGLEAAAKELYNTEPTWEWHLRRTARALRAYFAAIENPAPVEEDPDGD